MGPFLLDLKVCILYVYKSTYMEHKKCEDYNLLNINNTTAFVHIFCNQ